MLTRDLISAIPKVQWFMGIRILQTLQFDQFHKIDQNSRNSLYINPAKINSLTETFMEILSHLR